VDARSTGMLVAAAGILVVLVGLLIMSGALSWFGRLPGDLRLGSGRVRVYVPLASMLLVSLALTLALYLLRRFF
jgi:hypothetical protein